MNLKIYEDSKNYTAQVIKLPVVQAIKGLDNLVSVNVQGNSCLIGKDSDLDDYYLFFPAECQLSHDFLHVNNLYRHSELNKDKTETGFFDDNRRVKAIKFKGIISSGFVCPLQFLGKDNYMDLKVGNEFNEIDGISICQKYIRPKERIKGMSNPRVKTIDNIVDSRMAPEHFSTEHLLKNTHKLNLDDYIAVTYKLHGTSARYFNTLVKRPLSLIDKIAKFFSVKIQETHYDYICASRKVVKSCGFEELPDKNHYYNDGDIWSKVGKEYFEGKLIQGECVYAEIIGRTYPTKVGEGFGEIDCLGSEIQSGYTYGLKEPKVYIYRISNINSQGIEIDLHYQQMKERSIQLGIDYCPELFYGTLGVFLQRYRSIDRTVNQSLEETLNNLFYNKLLEQSSILDSSVVEEGFCIRIDKYPKPEIFKIKSKKFLLHEGALLDKVDSVDIEVEQSIV